MATCGTNSGLPSVGGAFGAGGVPAAGAGRGTGAPADAIGTTGLPAGGRFAGTGVAATTGGDAPGVSAGTDEGARGTGCGEGVGACVGVPDGDGEGDSCAAVSAGSTGDGGCPPTHHQAPIATANTTAARTTSQTFISACGRPA